ncbi:MAG: hypothetical protein KAS81_07130, partial [Anaerolineales bacterium]|nr:hypothetical protein [Anaerolineales bacterium]
QPRRWSAVPLPRAPGGAPDADFPIYDSPDAAAFGLVKLVFRNQGLTALAITDRPGIWFPGPQGVCAAPV